MLVLPGNWGYASGMCNYLELLRDVRATDEGAGESVGMVKENDETLVLPGEMHLQALWFAGQMGRDFTTVDGKSVKIVQFGYWNHAAGPDFLHASVEIGGELKCGAIELDHSVGDWEGHGHAGNEAFNEVVLHVVFTAEEGICFTRNQAHQEVPRLVVSEEVIREALSLPPANIAVAHPGRCFQPLAAMDDACVEALMEQAAGHRASIKAQRRSRTVDVLGGRGWLWQAIAETLGYRPNKLSMMMLSQRLPVEDFYGQGRLGTLLKRPEEFESVLFGAAGFLSAELHDQARDEESRGYLRDLWESWWRVRGDFEPMPERRIPWQFSGIRPVNHPQRRLACLAQVALRWEEFIHACRTVNGVKSFFQDLQHPYWSYHYTLQSKRSRTRLSLLGADRIQDFQVNHLLPVKLADGDREAWEFYKSVAAPALSEKVDKAALRLFGETDKRKKFLRKAWQHQALLQIYQDFCLRDVSDCKMCPFPEQLAQWGRS